MITKENKPWHHGTWGFKNLKARLAMVARWRMRALQLESVIPPHWTGYIRTESKSKFRKSLSRSNYIQYIQHHPITYPTAVMSSHEVSGAPPEMTWALKSLRPLQVKDLSGPGMVASASSRSRYFSYRKSQQQCFCKFCTIWLWLT